MKKKRMKTTKIYTICVVCVCVCVCVRVIYIYNLLLTLVSISLPLFRLMLSPTRRIVAHAKVAAWSNTSARMLSQCNNHCIGIKFVLKAKTGSSSATAIETGRMPAETDNMIGYLHAAVKGNGRGTYVQTAAQTFC